MSRKLLSLVVAVAFVLTTISTAFASALPSDVTAEFSKAVSKVQALNIMIGDAGTGLFRPADTIKRSEFAVIAVKALGLNDSAIISKGATKFSDVAADNWASGYINVAVSAGIVSGYPDGTYQPDKTINYAEAITILGNLLGYGPVLVGKPWPGAYVAQANAAGVTNGVVLAPTVGASRGNVAKLVSNTLDAKVVNIDTYDINGKPTYKVGTTDADTLLAKKLNITVVADSSDTSKKVFWVKKTPMVDSQATIADSTLKNVDTTTTAITKGFVDGLNPNDYLGLDVKFWQNSDDKIVTSEIQNSTSDIYTGLVENDGGKLKLTGTGTSYEKADDFVAYVNNMPVASVTAIAAMVADPVKGVGTVILRDGRIRFANLYIGSEVAQAGITNRTFTVKEITDGYIKSWGPSVTDIKVQDIKDNGTKKLVRYDIIRNGADATVDDIKVGDVVQRIGLYGTDSNMNHERWIVTSNEIKGSLTTVSGTDSTMTLTVGGKDYKVAANSLNQWSFNNGDDWDKNTSNVKDIIGKDVTIKLDAAGEVANLLTTAGSTTYYYGAVRSFATNVGANLDNAVTLYKQDGTKVSYSFDKIGDVIVASGSLAAVKYDTADVNGTYKDSIATGDLVQYQLTSDGKIKEATLKRFDRLGKANPSTPSVRYADDGIGYSGIPGPGNLHDNYISLSGNNGGIFTSASTILNAYPMLHGGTDDAQLIGFSSIDGKYMYNYEYVVNNNVIKALVADTDGLAAGKSGVVVGTGIDADGSTVTINEAGTVKVYKEGNFSSVAFNVYMKAGTFVSYNVGSDGKLSTLVPDVNTPVASYGNVISTFAASSVHVFRVMSIDTANKTIKLEHLNVSTKMATGSDYFFRYDTANLDVYNAIGKGDSPVVILGGKTIADIQANAYVWVGGGNGAAYDFSKVVILKVDDINNN
jgi:hypothetical protein